MKLVSTVATWVVVLAAGAACGQSEFGVGDEVKDPVRHPSAAPVANTKAIRPMIGFGMSMSNELRLEGEEDPYGTGLFLEVDRVWRANRAIQPLAYVGAVFTTPYDNSCSHPDGSCNISASTVSVGGKVRVMIPIPWVGPFVETGIGVSAGRITTMDGGSDDRQDSGVLMHVPFSLGLAMGENHGYTLVFTYLFYPNKNHVDGALAVGFDIPLG